MACKFFGSVTNVRETAAAYRSTMAACCLQVGSTVFIGACSLEAAGQGIPRNCYSVPDPLLCHAVPGLEVRWYMPVWYTGTSLVGFKSYRHFFLDDCHTGMP